MAAASYVYGIVPADVEVAPGTLGVGEPPGEVSLVTFGKIAALVSEVDVERGPLGRMEDLRTHQRLLDETAAEVPVLPFRFGAVMTGPGAVADELLAPHHDEFASALDKLEGRIEYVVKGRYVEREILREILAENEEAARLREAIRGRDEAVTRNERMRLGEIVEQAISAKREEDTREVIDALAPLCVAVSEREPTHERDAAYVALLVEDERQDDLRRAVEELGERVRDRIEVRLLGPLAPYDFTPPE
ncbi:hypothetical protein HNP84_008365 [Thermocatellispora tengchongensis]|uniref:Gas vesicle protein GvpFL n=1 Tax=Thermocatellispora tengchongensis TaxID=1073253 RepID=A0A840PLD8_9ACTN|nr:GvpL/GvpF family gas vesicle protein [Thermocatellispora tengchongensis]MBB5138611.1 hypothetical protein [Thermocatellispora tengchongensis]